MAKRDLYEVLGVGRDASALEIKRAFRLRAVRLHPDQNPSTDAAPRFEELREAYAVLSDDARRALYDRHGMGAVEAAPETRRDDLDDLFRRARPEPQARPAAAPGRRGHVSARVGAASRGSGPAATLVYERIVPCRRCGGGGGEGQESCAGCLGTGRRPLRRGLHQASVACGACGGMGTVPERVCPACSGRGEERELARLALAPFLAPRRRGVRVERLAGKGDERRGEAAGDLFLVVEEPEEEAREAPSRRPSRA